MAMIIANTKTLYASQGDYKGLYGYSSSTNKIQVIIGEENNNFSHPWGGFNWLESEGSRNNELFHLTFDSLPKEACLAISTTDWGNEQSSGVVGIRIDSGYISWDAFEYYYNCLDSSSYEYIINNSYTACKTRLPLLPSTAAQYCGLCDTFQNCGITLFVR